MTTKKLVIYASVLWFTGPVIIILGLLSGARLLDGLFGVYHNTPLQSAALSAGFLVTVIGWLAAAVMTIVALFKMWHSSNKVVLTVLAVVSFMTLALLAPIFFPDLNYF